jgi:hypothetical protein
VEEECNDVGDGDERLNGNRVYQWYSGGSGGGGGSMMMGGCVLDW